MKHRNITVATHLSNKCLSGHTLCQTPSQILGIWQNNKIRIIF